MKVVQLIVYCATLSTVWGTYPFYWVDHGGICTNSHGYSYHCIHYGNCFPKYYHQHVRGQTKTCGFYHGAIIMCCSQHLEEDYIEDLIPPSEYDYDFIKYPSRTGQSKVTTQKPTSTTVKQYQGLPHGSTNGDDDIAFGKGVHSYKYGQEHFFMDDCESETEKIVNTITTPPPLKITTEDHSISIENKSVIKNITENEKNSTPINPPRVLFTSPALEPTESTKRNDQDKLFTNENQPKVVTEETTVAQSESTETTVIGENNQTDLTQNQTESMTFIAETQSEEIPAEMGAIEKNNQTDLALNQTRSVILIEETTTTEPINATTIIVQTDLVISENESVAVPLQSPPRTPNPLNLTSRTMEMEQQEVQMDSQNMGINFPYYPPVPENSTSLRKCKDLYENTSREDAWMYRTMNKAELGYGNQLDIQWLCTGSLISDRYVLTAANCRFAKMNLAKYVRVGSYRTVNPLNQQMQQNFTIEDFIPHPLYNSSFARSQHDIAVVRLNASVIFTEFVRPGCLATKFNLASIPLWLPSIVPINFVHITTNRCKKLYNDTENVISDVFQGCAVTDSYFFCQYDLGAPFVFANAEYDFGNFPEIVGIASYGNPCGDTPAVSTRVLPYVPWIETNVWPN